jgi:hypothetical protein
MPAVSTTGIEETRGLETLPGKMFLKYTNFKIVEFWDSKPSSSVDRYTLKDHSDIPTKTQLYFPEGSI